MFMKILFVHNSYSDRNPSGEEYASQELAALLEEYGHEVRGYQRSSDEIRGVIGRIKAFFTGIYNPCSAKELARLLDDFKPDIVQVQNIYPLISSSIFNSLKVRNIPVVMRCPNYRLFCPNGLCLDTKGHVCEKCFGGKEWCCIKKNCERSILKSIGYALRNAYTRASRNIINGVDIFIVQSDFQKQKFVEQGISADKLVILPGISPQQIASDTTTDLGENVSFVGRISVEKGINEFIEAARLNPCIPFKVAGKLDAHFKMPNGLPQNVDFVGYKKGDDLDSFYSESRIIAVPSKWYEGFPNVIVRAMLHRRPVITTNIGAMPSIIDDGVNGLLVEPGNAKKLSHAISRLYNDEDCCRKMGLSGYEKASKQYSRDAIYQRLMGVYRKVINK